MKKLLLLFAVMLSTVGAWAQEVVTHINVNCIYTLKCIGGESNKFIADDGTVINGQSAEGTYFCFEKADGENQYYIKSVKTDKYINYNGTQITASSEKSTAWTFGVTTHTSNVVTFATGTKYLNNNQDGCDATCSKLRVVDHGAGGPGSGNTCSLWKLEDYGPLVTFTNVQKDGTKYAVYINESNELAISSTETAESLGDAAKFRATKKSNGKYTFYNEAKGLYMIWRGKSNGHNSDKGVLTEYNADYCDWTLNNSSNSKGDFYIVGKRNNKTDGSLIILNNGTFDAYGNSEGWASGYSNVFEIDGLAGFTYTLKNNGEVKGNAQSFVTAVGNPFPAPSLPAYTTCTLPEGKVEKSHSGESFDVECAYTLPFEVSEDYATAKWYYMNIRGNKWVAHSDNPPYSNRKERYPDIYGQWAFIGNPFDGIQVLNRGAGDGKTLGYDGLGTGSNIHMKDGTTTWNITEGNGGFALHMGAGTNRYIHDYSSKLQIWDASGARTDAGSAFQVEAVEEFKFHQIWGNHYPWTTEVLTEVPAGVEDCQYHDDGLANIRMAQTKIIAKGGDVTVLFQYTSGSHMLMIVGVDIVQDGIVVKSDYHEGKTGGLSSGNTYTLSGVGAGEYTLRYFVCQKTSGDENLHYLTETNGNITVDGAKRANVDVKYVFNLDGVEKEQSESVPCVPGDKYPDITNEFPYGIRVTKPSGTIVDADIVNGTVTKTIQLEEVLPFYKSASFEDATWYLVDMHSNDTGTPSVSNGTNTYVWTYVPESETNNVQLPQEARKQNALFTDNKLWCFVGNAYDGFKIYNKAAGDGLTLNKPSDNNTVAKMTNANDATLYELRESSQIDGAVCFLPKGHTYYLNTQMNNGLGVKVLQGWNENDGGSSCRFFAPTHFVKDAILAEYDSNVPACAVGSKVAMTKECYNALAESLQSIQADGWNTSAVTEGVTEYLSALQASDERIQIQDGGYYFVKGTGDGNNASWYLSHSVQNDNNSLWAKAPGMLNADYIWKFEAVEDGYKVQSANLGKYFQLKTATNGGDNNTYVTETFEQGNKMFAEGVSGTNCKFIIKNSDNQNMRTEDDGQVNYWSGENSESWYIIHATELDITIGNAGWATTCLPFDVVLPDDLTAYALTDVANVNGEETGSVSLISKAGIKAKEGALLKGDAGTYTLSIEETSSDWDANLLSGTTVAKDMSAVEGDVYLLASDGAGSAQLSKLVLATDATEAKKTLAANKAYLNIAPSAARFLVFNFGDDNATAIDNILGTENAADVVVYDLAGRRVQKAQKGLYIVNGKKVIK